MAGLALALAFPDYNVPLLAWVSVAALIVASLGASVGEAALCGFAYGVAFYTFSIPWIYTVMRQYGPLPVYEAAGVMALLVVQQSSYIFFSVCRWRGSRGAARIAPCWQRPFLWVAVELLRSRLGPLSFPWDLLGYATVSQSGSSADRLACGCIRPFVCRRGVQCAAGLVFARALCVRAAVGVGAIQFQCGTISLASPAWVACGYIARCSDPLHGPILPAGPTSRHLFGWL